MNSATVTALPSAAAAPVINPRLPGRRPKGVISLQKKRIERVQGRPRAERELAPAMAVSAPPAIPGKFHYPKAMLSQEYFCRGGTGVWYLPSMNMDMLVNERFLSPLGALLDQLEREGHDVGGARAEWMAFRELIGKSKQIAKSLENIGDLLRRAAPDEVADFLQSGSDGL